jgi:hypothetical protein
MIFGFEIRNRKWQKHLYWMQSCWFDLLDTWTEFQYQASLMAILVMLDNLTDKRMYRTDGYSSNALN